jgi:hypothetical protein
MDLRVRSARKALLVQKADGNRRGNRRSFRGRQAIWVSQGKAADRLDLPGPRASLGHLVRLDLLGRRDLPELLPSRGTGNANQGRIPEGLGFPGLPSPSNGTPCSGMPESL